MKKKILLCFLFLLIISYGVSAASEAEVYLKNVLKQIHLARNFQGEIVTRVNMGDTVLTYKTGILKDDKRADVSTMHTFWQLKGTQLGRKIRSIPWFYLPPDFSLVQYALPIERRSTMEEPLVRIGYDYSVKIKKNEGDRIIFELSNDYLIQEVEVDSNRNIILKITVSNTSGKVIAFIEYVNWKEYYSGVLLPECIRVRDGDGKIILEMIYLNWKVNQGVSGLAKTLPVEWSQAVENLKTRILQNPGDDNLHYQLAMLYKKQGFWSYALEELDKALTLNPRLDYREEMVKAYEKLGMNEEAINHLLVILETKETADKYYQLGNLYTKINNPMLAGQAYEQAVDLDPDNYIYLERLFWNYRNVSIEDERMLKKAVQVGEKLIKVNPDYQYQLYLGDLYMQNNQSDKALESYKKAQELNPEESLPYIKMAGYYEKAGNISEALVNYNNAIKADEHWWNYLQLGDFYLRQVKIEEALLAYEESLQMNPRNTDLNIKIGKILWQLGQKEEAKTYWYQALEFEESNIYTYIKVGETLLEYNLIDEAEEVFERAVDRFQILEDQSVKPGLSRIYEEIGLLNIKKDPGFAMECFEKAYSIQPRSTSGLYLGLKELKQGNLNLAINLWSEANFLDSESFLPYVYLTVVKGLRGEVLGSQSKEIGFIQKYLTVEEKELMNKFFSYFPVIRNIITENENTVKEAEIAYNKGMEEFLEGKLLNAITEFEKAVKHDKLYRKGHFFLGVSLSLMGRTEEAQSHFKVIEDYFAGSSAAKVAVSINRSIERLFWNIKIL